MASTNIQDPLGEAPTIAPAAPAPTPLQAAAPGMVGGQNPLDIARQAMPMPSEAERQKKESEYADAVQGYINRHESLSAGMEAKKRETEIAVQQYEALAKQFLPQVQQPQPAPARGLQPFLASTKEEDPYTTISKAIQAVSLFATMVGGGRNGARASISAMTGALEGWREGSRYKADAAYQTWKAETENMLKQFDDEMRRYNSLMIAERVPLDQKLRAMEIAAYEYKNAMATEAFKVGKAQDALKYMNDAMKSSVGLQVEIAKIDALKEERDRKHQEVLDKVAEQTRQFNLQQSAGWAKLGLQMEMQKQAQEHAMKMLGMKVDLGLAGAGQKSSETERAKWTSYKDTESIISKLDELMNNPKVNLRKIVGGINPWVNSFIQKWGQGNSPTPTAGTGADDINTKKMGTLTDEERQFLALLKNYGDSVLRQRSGAAISQYELTNLLQFVADPSQAPEVVRSRLALARNENRARAENLVSSFRDFGVKGPGMDQFAPSRIGGGPTPPQVWVLRGADGKERRYQPDPGEKEPPAGYTRVR